MADIFLSAGMRIDAQKGILTNHQGDVLKLRPKTFQLLLLLIRNPDTQHSKSDILQQVWSDVVVGEHVIFQSIKEIRQLFDQQDVIKTVPRQGYNWIAPVERVDDTETLSTPDVSAPKRRLNPTFFALVATCVLLVALLIQLSFPQPQPVEGSILVLPVNIQTDDNDHNWVRLGGMDQLTQRLASSASSGVLHTDYVLEVMERAGAPTQGYTAADIKQIFTVSGAALVVELTLAGTPREYQLTYQLHRRNGIDKGVVFAEHIREVFEQMAQRLATDRGIHLIGDPKDYAQGFANEIIANALEAKRSQDMAKAKQLLQAAALSEPENLTAKRLLLEMWVAEKAFDKSEPLIEQASRIMQQSDAPTREHVRLYFWFALNQLQQQNLAAARPFLARSEALATELKDWLYLAYIAEIRGQMAQFSQAYDDAEQAYTKAMTYHEVLQCPHGQSNGLLNLSMLAEERGQREQASEHLSQALSLIKTRELNTLLPKAERWRERLTPQQQKTAN